MESIDGKICGSANKFCALFFLPRNDAPALISVPSQNHNYEFFMIKQRSILFSKHFVEKQNAAVVYYSLTFEVVARGLAHFKQVTGKFSLQILDGSTLFKKEPMREEIRINPL
jgi:hypothetical protein